MSDACAALLFAKYSHEGKRERERDVEVARVNIVTREKAQFIRGKRERINLTRSYEDENAERSEPFHPSRKELGVPQLSPCVNFLGQPGFGLTIIAIGRFRKVIDTVYHRDE